jgi:hypothetical protein
MHNQWLTQKLKYWICKNPFYNEITGSLNQESVNMKKVFFENCPSESFDYITKSNNILENILVQNIDEASQEAPF